jgi:hypothetical protein
MEGFLAARGLTSERVESYLRYRIQILRFIEGAFPAGDSHCPGGD